MPTGNQIFADTLGASDTGWTGKNSCTVCGTGSLVAANPGCTFVRITLTTLSTTSAANLDSLWVGEQQSSPVQQYNFDGNQVQLTFSGVAGVTGITGATTLISDGVPFNYTGPGTPLVVRAHWSGTTVDATKNNSSFNNVIYDLFGSDQSGVTAPTGSWSTQANANAFLISVEMLTGLMGQACL